MVSSWDVLVDVIRRLKYIVQRCILSKDNIVTRFRVGNQDDR